MNKKKNKKPVTEHQYFIDLRWLKRQGYLTPGGKRNIRWNDSKPVYFTITKSQITLEYSSWLFGFDQGVYVVRAFGTDQLES